MYVKKNFSYYLAQNEGNSVKGMPSMWCLICNIQKIHVRVSLKCNKQLISETFTKRIVGLHRRWYFWGEIMLCMGPAQNVCSMLGLCDHVTKKKKNWNDQFLTISAIISCITSRTFAVVRIGSVDAISSVSTWVRCAQIKIWGKWR